MNTKRKAVFLDRDGVINKPVYRNGKLASPRSLNELRFPFKIKESLDLLRKANFELVIITNQPDIARGFMSINELNLINSKIKSVTGINHIYACIHDDSDNCFCRKPKTGLIEKAIIELDLRTKDSFLIGDQLRDIQAGLSMNIESFMLKENFGIDDKNNDYTICSDIYEAVTLILRKKHA